MIDSFKKRTAEQIHCNTEIRLDKKEVEYVAEKIRSILESSCTDDSIADIIRLDDCFSQEGQKISEKSETALEETNSLMQEINSEAEKSEEIISVFENMKGEVVKYDAGDIITAAEEDANELKELSSELADSIQISVDSTIKSMIDKTVMSDRLPGENKGTWIDGEAGNGFYALNDNEVFTCGKISMTGLQIKNLFGAVSVTYKDNEPDFMPFAVNNGTVCPVPVSKMPTNRTDSYHEAEKYCAKMSGMTVKEIRRYMKENNLTWHETADRKFIIPVPSIINAAFPHTGGISKQQSFEAVSYVMNRKLSKVGAKGYVLTSAPAEFSSGTVGGKSLKRAISSARGEYRAEKSRLFANKKKKVK